MAVLFSKSAVGLLVRLRHNIYYTSMVSTTRVPSIPDCWDAIYINYDNVIARETNSYYKFRGRWSIQSITSP